jgi:1,4-dihydroxy-2-naphthoate octaprenyltransferase
VPLGYLGLGDPLVFLFFGVFAVTGTYYVQAGGVSGLALAASIPVACLATAILAVNNLRDLETDREAGKRTLAVRVGPEATRRYISALLWTPYLVCGALALVGAAGVGVLLPWLCAPLASRLEHSVARAQGAELNPCLARTARLELLFGALLALGLLA